GLIVQYPIVVVSLRQMQLLIVSANALSNGMGRPEIQRRARHRSDFPRRNQRCIHRRVVGDILKQVMQINASHYTPVDATLIPTGKIAPVAGTPLDFRTPHAIGERIGADNEQLHLAKGYDHNWVLDNKTGKVAEAAKAFDPSTGRTLEVLTDQPGVQFYTGNFLDGTIKGIGGKIYVHRGAFCLETQHFPDSPNHANFPSTELKAGGHYHTVTIFRFGVQPK